MCDHKKNIDSLLETIDWGYTALDVILRRWGKFRKDENKKAAIVAVREALNKHSNSALIRITKEVKA